VKNGAKKCWGDEGGADDGILEGVTLVAFHPRFLRWRGLPGGVGVGSEVRSHWGAVGRKSADAAPATIVETNNGAFGMRKVKVRFRRDDSTDEGAATQPQRRREQYVPTDWIVDLPGRGPQLPDNFMYRSPHATIHVIVDEDLASLSLRDVSRVKRLNSRRMAEMGWEGLERLMMGRGMGDK